MFISATISWTNEVWQSRLFRLWTCCVEQFAVSELRLVDCRSTLHRRLKSHYFQLAFNQLFY